MNPPPTSTRRSFLRSATIATAAFASLGPAATAPAATSPGRRIGFVDNDLNNYHSNVFLQALRDPLKDRGFTLDGCTALKESEGRTWADKNQVSYFTDPKALNDAVDFYLVLAPSSPETHLQLCQRILPFGKATYVDKTFAPDLATASEIFALADRHRTPIQTTSALRYTNVQQHVRSLPPGSVEHMVAWGGGGSFAEYAIHPLELLISVMGPDATALMRRGTGNRSQLLINFSGDRTGVVNVYPQSDTPFAASVTTAKGTKYLEVDASKIFVDNLAAILDFFTSGKPNVERRESLAIMKVLDAAKDPRALKEFVPLA